jgi:hypothetical protein
MKFKACATTFKHFVRRISNYRARFTAKSKIRRVQRKPAPSTPSERTQAPLPTSTPALALTHALAPALGAVNASIDSNSSYGVILGSNSSWIDVVKSWLGSGSLELLYRASRDGWTAHDFHRCCDNRGPTLVIVQSEENWVFGGYAAASWNSNGHNIQSAGNTSFLFTLKNPHDLPPTKYACTAYLSHELQGDAKHGPMFGRGFDLYICDGANNSFYNYTVLGTAYKDTTGHGKRTFTGKKIFRVGEYEVFAVK